MYSFQYARRRGLVTAVKNPFRFKWENRHGWRIVYEKGDTLIELWLLEHRPELLEDFRERVRSARIFDRNWALRSKASQQLVGAFSWRGDVWPKVYTELLKWEESTNQIY